MREFIAGIIVRSLRVFVEGERIWRLVEGWRVEGWRGGGVEG